MKLFNVVEPYSGKGDVEEFLQKLRSAEAMFGELKTSLLPLLLKDEAFRVYADLDEDRKAHRGEVELALRQAFGLDQFRAFDMLSAARMESGESVDGLCARIRRLLALACMPIAGPTFVNFFVKALPEEVRGRVRREARAQGTDRELVTLATSLLLDRPKHLVSVGSAPSNRGEQHRGRELCGRCGGPMHKKGQVCPSIVCFNCGKRGHVARLCTEQKNSSGSGL